MFEGTIKALNCKGKVGAVVFRYYVVFLLYEFNLEIHQAFDCFKVVFILRVKHSPNASRGRSYKTVMR